MRMPLPTECPRHCWGKRRRIAKKTEKGMWKAAEKLAKTSSWEAVGFFMLGISSARDGRHALQLLRQEIKSRRKP